VATPEFTHWIRNFDKIVHFSVYGLLATLILRASQYHHRWRWSPWITLAIVFVFGGLDEWHQSFVPGRSCDLADWLADASGATLAVLLYRFWGGYRRALEASLRPGPRAVDAAKAP
jgi:VanZ family protein